MATQTISGGATFPEGTSVGAYLRNQWPVESLSGAPSGAAVATATVTSGALTFTGLADNTEYVAYAGSPDRYRRFSTPAPAPSAGTGELPWRAEITPFTAPSAQTTWTAVNGVSALVGGGTKESTGAQNSDISWDVVLGAGTWTVSLVHRANADRGIYTVLIDEVSVGTIDGYAAALANNKVDAVAGVTVASGGKHRLTLRMATKNASATNYIGSLQAISLVRTA